MKKVVISLMALSLGLSVANAFDVDRIAKRVERVKEVRKDVAQVRSDVKDKNYTGAIDNGKKIAKKAKEIYKKRVESSE